VVESAGGRKKGGQGVGKAAGPRSWRLIGRPMGGGAGGGPGGGMGPGAGGVVGDGYMSKKNLGHRETLPGGDGGSAKRFKAEPHLALGGFAEVVRERCTEGRLKKPCGGAEQNPGPTHIHTLPKNFSTTGADGPWWQALAGAGGA